MHHLPTGPKRMLLRAVGRRRDAGGRVDQAFARLYGALFLPAN